MATRIPRAGTTLCCVSIGHQDFVLSLDKGLKLVALLKDAKECDRTARPPSYKSVFHLNPNQPPISMEVLVESQFTKVPLMQNDLGDDE